MEVFWERHSSTSWFMHCCPACQVHALLVSDCMAATLSCGQESLSEWQALVQGLIYTAGIMWNVLHFFNIPLHVQEVTRQQQSCSHVLGLRQNGTHRL